MNDPELLYALRWVYVGLVCGVGMALSKKLENAQRAIKLHGSQKALAMDLGVSESRLTRKLQADSGAVLNLRDLDRMPEEIQRTFHFFEVLRLGLPELIDKSVDVAGAIRRQRRKA